MTKVINICNKCGSIMWKSIIQAKLKGDILIIRSASGKSRLTEEK